MTIEIDKKIVPIHIYVHETDSTANARNRNDSYSYDNNNYFIINLIINLLICYTINNSNF